MVKRCKEKLESFYENPLIKSLETSHPLDMYLPLPQNPFMAILWIGLAIRRF